MVSWLLCSSSPFISFLLPPPSLSSSTSPSHILFSLPSSTSISPLPSPFPLPSLSPFSYLILPTYFSLPSPPFSQAPEWGPGLQDEEPSQWPEHPHQHSLSHSPEQEGSQVWRGVCPDGEEHATGCSAGHQGHQSGPRVPVHCLSGWAGQVREGYVRIGMVGMEWGVWWRDGGYGGLEGWRDGGDGGDGGMEGWRDDGYGGMVRKEG